MTFWQISNCLKVDPDLLYMSSGILSETYSVFLLQACMFVPNVDMSCSPAGPNMSIHHPGQPSQKPFMKTVFLNTRRDGALTR